MKSKNYAALAFIAVASVLAPMHVSALSVYDYEHQPRDQKDKSYTAAVDNAIKTAYDASQDFGSYVADYFTTVPKGSPQTKGFILFQAHLQQADKDAQGDNNYLKQKQIEDILLNITNDEIMTDYINSQSQPAAAKTSQPPAGQKVTAKP